MSGVFHTVSLQAIFDIGPVTRYQGTATYQGAVVKAWFVDTDGGVFDDSVVVCDQDGEPHNGATSSDVLRHIKAQKAA